MNKIIKGVIIGVVAYEVCNLMFYTGKATTLGLLLNTGVSAKEICEELQNDNHLRAKYMAKFANTVAKKIES